MKKKIVVAVSLGTFLLMGIVDCGPTETPSKETLAPTLISGNSYSEAPQLAHRVATGDLPPVEERLPKNPVVVQPVERVGVYGGTWRMGLLGGGDTPVIKANAGYESLVRWDPAWFRIVPNLAQSYEVNEEATEFVFHLREGLRWSDGVPFTADDILFWYKADLLHEELHSSVKAPWQVNDIPVVVEKIDDHTVKFGFAGPHGQFPYLLAEVNNDWIAARPMHYMKQFHIDYNPEGIDKLVEEAGVDNWVKLYKSKSNGERNPDKPAMHAWVLVDWYNAESTSVVMERNPYYWKVDTELSQLPYIDRIHFTVFSSEEDLRQAAMEGHIDAQFTRLQIAANYGMYFASMTEGQYDFHTLIPSDSNGLAIHLNLVHQDPELRAVFSDKTFRIALSHAINRVEVIDRVYGLDLEPRQPAPRKESPYYREQLATQYTEFDLPYANELLDQAGYDRRDGEGYRLTAEGRRISFTMTVTAGNREALIAAEMFSEYWREVGVMTMIAELSRVDRENLAKANQHDAIVMGSKGGVYVTTEPFTYMPSSVYESFYAIPWAYWYQDSSQGEEPPAHVKLQQQLYDQIRGCAEPECMELLIEQILAIAEEQFYVMGISLAPNQYMLVRSDFHNVPRTMPYSWAWPTPAPTNPCQYFIDPQE